MPSRKKEASDKMSKVDYAKLQEKIIENLIGLQKVQTNIAEKFDKLSEQITGLLNLFESAARSFAEHPANMATEKDKEFLDKIDKLLEQNKTLAKGLTLMEERIRERVYSSPDSISNEDIQKPINRPLPRF